MSVQQPYDIYQEQLTTPHHGLALWRPDPVEDIYDQVSIGDVGYVYEGVFFRLFNVTLPWDDQSNRRHERGPEHYNPLTFTGVDRNTFTQVDFYSPSVYREENTGNAQAWSPDQSEGVTYRCKGHGALLSLPHGGCRETAIQRKVFEKYIQGNVVGWFNWSRDIGLPVERLEDLVLVYGCTWVNSWAAAAFDDRATEAQISLTSRALNNREACFDWRNIRGAVEYHHGQVDPVGSHTKNHCVFIKCFRAKRPFFRIGRLRAAAEPLPDEPDNTQEDEIQVTQVPSALKCPDPLIGVLDYIVEKCLKDDMDTGEDGMAITHHDDLLLIRDVETLTADAVEQFLRENDMPLLVADGALMLGHLGQIRYSHPTSALSYMPAQQAPTRNVQVRRHRDYFLADGDIIFKVENIVFRVHKFFFHRESAYFRSIFRSPPIPCNDPPGLSETNPVVLKDTTSEAFAGLCWVFYNPKYSVYTAPVDKWVEILALAQRWAFKEVEQLCIRELQKLPIAPVEKIHIYQAFFLDRSLLAESFEKLTIRAEPLNLEEGQKLGIETTLQIIQARELSRGSSSGTRASAIQLNGSDLHSVILDVFGFEEDAFDFLTGPSPPPPPPHPSTTENANGRGKK